MQMNSHDMLDNGSQAGEAMHEPSDNSLCFKELTISSLLDAVSCGVAIVDAGGRVVEANRLFCEMVSVDWDDIIGMSVDGFHHGSVFQRAAELSERFRTDRTSRPYVLQRPMGQAEVELHIRPVYQAETYAGMVLSVVDITEPVRLRQKAEASDRAKGTFLSNLSSEMITPLESIGGLIDAAMESPLSDEQRETLTAVRDQAGWLRTNVGQLMDFTKLETGRIDIQAMEFNVRDEVKSAVSVLSIEAEQKGLEVLCSIHPDVPEFVVSDARHLHKIVANLLSNAIRFTERGHVIVSIGLDSRKDDDCTMHLAVTDTGIGIPPDRQQRIFGAFVRSESAGSRRGGIGLRLSIVAQLVEMLNGRIWVESEVGKGTTFHVSIGMKLVKSTSAPSPVLTGLNAIIVDDNPIGRKVLETLCRSAGMRTQVFASADVVLANLATLRKESAEAVWFVDVELAGVSGLDLVRTLRSGGDPVKAIVMMLMPSEMEHHVTACQELGVPYVRKPVFRADLVDAALQAIGRRQVVVRKRADDEEEVSPDEPPVQARVLQVILAEDNAVNRKFTARMLEHRGHKVVALPDGKEVLETVKKGNIDIILMDIEMPEVDGVTATRQVREWERANGGHVPIIAMTGRDAADDRKQCIAAGMDEHLTKPVSPDDLFETISRRVPGFQKA